MNNDNLESIRNDLNALIDANNATENTTAHASPEYRKAMLRGNALRTALNAVSEVILLDGKAA